MNTDISAYSDLPLPTPEKRKLGSSELETAPLAWGMWRFAGLEVNAAERLVEETIATGINLFDTADIYGIGSPNGFGSAEALLGKVFGAKPGLRESITLASKAGIRPPVPYNSSKEYLIKACEDSLLRLGTDYLDLFQIHRPDILTHPSEVAEALTILRKSGKIRYVGVSNHTVDQTKNLQTYLDFKIVSTQPECSLLHIEPIVDGFLDYTIKDDLGVLAWSPLGGGRIANPQNEREKSICNKLDNIAADYNVSRTTAAYSWLMAHPAGIVPIIGSQNIKRIKDAISATSVKWTRSSWYTLYETALGRPLP